ncbi:MULTISPECIES: hypothetical protein [Protofrankia]|uniref:Uncharacterized protein n=1 Tax=Protofrankia coriariae TaxID=1562887 RepID=A0ABR5F6D2_9ACTN|nr:MULTISPECIES: hypothetical protein [Protofrankia]KLL12291.1 hypothetical protein FrCorBMG51_06310 [Protofrankia coriariae]ONH37767.1 hypothetical protein BL254_02490 [Protofrankia sp. BMG5.30]
MRHSNDGPAKPTAIPVPDAIPNHTRGHARTGGTARHRGTSGRPANGRAAGSRVLGGVPGDHRRACAAPVSRPGREPAAFTLHPSTVHPSSEPVPPVQNMIIIKSGIPDLSYRHGVVAVPALTGRSR